MAEPAEFQARMIEENRPAFIFWCRVCSLIEDAIVTPRNIQPAYARALDMLFIQAFKSFSSLYVLCVRGLGEDAATILRRLLEVSMQAKFLAQDPKEREDRGRRYMAYFWAQVPTDLRRDLDPATRRWWQEMFERHRGFLSFHRHGQVKNWWGGTIRDLFAKLRREDTYDEDYNLLSQMAHGTSQGILLEKRAERIEILTGRMVPEILVFGCRYVLLIAQLWNECFNVIDEETMSSLMAEALAFNFGAKRKMGKAEA